MGITKIEWADYTFNPWIGCAKVSPGCTNCYAERQMDERLRRVRWGTTGTRVRTSPANWAKPLQWERQAAAAGERRRVFCASLADVFEDMERLASWRIDLWHLIDITPHLDWMLLTKRPENIGGMLPIPHRNVWLGSSVERQQEADLRIAELLRCPAAVRFVSYEPALGPVDFTSVNHPNGTDTWNVLTGEWVSKKTGCLTHDDGGALDWMIAGGESGPNARPAHPDWFRSVRDQCQAAGVPFFFKQQGEWSWQVPCGLDRKCDAWVCTDGRFTADERVALADGGRWQGMWRVGKGAAGRLLDEQEWNEFPKGRT
jgi:protein gp37